MSVWYYLCFNLHFFDEDFKNDIFHIYIGYFHLLFFFAFYFIILINLFILIGG